MGLVDWSTGIDAGVVTVVAAYAAGLGAVWAFVARARQRIFAAEAEPVGELGPIEFAYLAGGRDQTAYIANGIGGR